MVIAPEQRQKAADQPAKQKNHKQRRVGRAVVVPGERRCLGVQIAQAQKQAREQTIEHFHDELIGRVPEPSEGADAEGHDDCQIEVQSRQAQGWLIERRLRTDPQQHHPDKEKRDAEPFANVEAFMETANGQQGVDHQAEGGERLQQGNRSGLRADGGDEQSGAREVERQTEPAFELGEISSDDAKLLAAFARHLHGADLHEHDAAVHQAAAHERQGNCQP